MKIFIEAFVDNNFGDNLFVHIITSRYPEYTFYMVEKEAYAKSYSVLEEQISNLVVLKEEGTLLEEMDGMFVVGGDMFGNGGDYGELIRQVYTIKKRGGVVAFIGISLFPEYSKKTWFDLMIMFSYADIIIVREQTTYEQLKGKFPWLRVTAATDLAFTADVTEITKEEVQKGLLGVSVRKKMHRDGEKYYSQYCSSMADQIIEYLQESQSNQVCLLALSSGRFDDRAVAMDIIQLCPDSLQARMYCSTFEGKLISYMKELQKCEKLLCTRFHALVFALLLEKPFIPIIYEEKMERLLNALGYKGPRPKYEESWGFGCLSEMISQKVLDREKYMNYVRKSEMIFRNLDQAMKVNKKKGCFFYQIYKMKRHFFESRK